MSIINKYDVSIVIPVYNKKDYVEECIKTVIDQIGLSFEIIVVDDGSTDGSAEILKQLKIKFPSIKLVSQVNKGLSEARNAGIKISKGKYIAFHDADDHMEAGSMKALFDIAEEFKSDVVGGVYRKIGKNGAYVAQDKYCELLVNINFNERYDDALLYCTNFSACNKLFRRKFIEDYELYFTPQLYMQDIEYWLKCMFATNKYTQTCVIVSTYNDIEGSWSKKFTRERFDSLFDLYENVSSYYEKHNLSKFLTIKNFAILQGALLFFARHILNEWSRDSDIPDDLFRIQSLLKHINEKDIVLFLNKYPAHVGSYLFPILYSGNFFLARYLSKHFKELRPILRKETDGKIFCSIENIVDLITDIRNIKYSDKPLYNIVLFAQSDLTNIGGVQRSYSLLTEHLVNRGFKITLVAQNVGNYTEHTLPLAYPLPSEVKIKLMSRTYGRDNFINFKNLLASERPDMALIVNSSRYALFIAAACICENIPYVISIRGSTEYCLRYLWPNMKTLDSVFAASRAAHVLMPSYKQPFSEAVRQKITVIPSQIEPAYKFSSSDQASKDGRFYILYSGRFSFEKRLHYLIDAFALLANKHPLWDLILCGKGPLFPKLKARVDEHGLGSRVSFLEVSNTDEMYKIYPTVHLKVLPSEQEGCPMALREAMSHRVPVIGYKECSGTNEIIEHGIDGLLVSDKFSPEKNLSDGIEKLITNPTLRIKMGFAAADKASLYQPKPINIKWEKLLIDSINKTGCASAAGNNDYIKIYQNAYKYIRNLAEIDRLDNPWTFILNKENYMAHREAYLLIYGHRLFDKFFYLEEYCDVKLSGEDPLLHYISDGWKRGYNPSPLFDTKRYQDLYMAQYPNLCPLVHYYKEGCFKNIKPIPVSTDYYEKMGRGNRKPEYDLKSDLNSVVTIYNNYINGNKDI